MKYFIQIWNYDKQVFQDLSNEFNRVAIVTVLSSSSSRGT